MDYGVGVIYWSGPHLLSVDLLYGWSKAVGDSNSLLKKPTGNLMSGLDRF